MSELSIGVLSKRSGVKIPTIRYYESIGLMPPPPRSAGGQRRYDTASLQRLKFIRHGRDLGFGLDDLRALQKLSDTPDQSCESADAIASSQLEEVERKIEGLVALRVELKRMLQQCAHGRVGECRVIESLSDHALCDHDHR
jgi:DNA-binding transcriptional MerR regulator